MSTSLSPSTDKQSKQQIKLMNLLIKVLIILFSLSILLFFYFFSDNALKLYEKYFVNNHQEVVTYLEKLDQYDNDSTVIVDSIRLELYRTDQEKFNNDVNKAKEDIQQLIAQTVALKTPQGFSQLKDTFVEVLKQRMLILTAYNNTKKTYVFNNLNSSINELKHKQDIERKTLLDALKIVGIKYKQVGNGSIRYWFKGHSAKNLEWSM